MKKLAVLVLAAAFLIPSVSSAATLTQPQVDAIISVLQAFGVDQQTVLAVETALAPSAPETSISTPSASPVFGGATQPASSAPVIAQPCTDVPIINWHEVNMGLPNNGGAYTVRAGQSLRFSTQVLGGCLGSIWDLTVSASSSNPYLLTPTQLYTGESTSPGLDWQGSFFFTPSTSGDYGVTITASDGTTTAFQNLDINVLDK